MKSYRVIAKTNITVADFDNSERIVVDPLDDLTPNQFQMMVRNPDMILQYAHYLRDRFKKKGVHDPAVYVRSQIGLSGRSPREYIDSNVHLANVNYPLFSHASWILDSSRGVPK